MALSEPSHPVPSLSSPAWTPASYIAAVVIIVLAILSQYFLPQTVPALRPAYRNLVGSLLIVYGIPVLACALLIGVAPLRRWKEDLRTATLEGLSWYAVLSLLAILVFVVTFLIYEAVDPAALKLLNKPNPVVQAAASDPWFWVGFSFVIGAIEETIFRGWVFGSWLAVYRGSWVVPATVSSALFAAVHLYYGTTYGVAIPLLLPELFLLGFAFAATYRGSHGNLVIIALLHGSYDASAFLTLVSPGVGVGIRFGLIGVGAIVAIVYWLGGSKGDSPPWPGRQDYGATEPLRGPPT